MIGDPRVLVLDEPFNGLDPAGTATTRAFLRDFADAGGTVFLSSLDGYGPLANFFAARGFAVVQPTHLDSGTLGLREADDPDAPLYAQARADDMVFILDHLDEIENAVPGLNGRLDRSRVAVVGHSLGGLTGCMLLGMRVRDPTGERWVNVSDDRIRTGVLLAPPGDGDDLNSFASDNYPVLRQTDFSGMRGPALFIVGDKDQNEMFSDRVSYRSDGYRLGPGPKTLLTMFNGEHMLGGVSGYDAAETTDEDPERVATLRALAWAYLRSHLYPDDPAWTRAVTVLESSSEPLDKVESK